MDLIGLSIYESKQMIRRIKRVILLHTSIFTTPLDEALRNIQIEILAIYRQLKSSVYIPLTPDKYITGLHIKHIPLIVGLNYPIIHH